MYVYQNGKLYIEHDDKIIGVEIYPDKIIRLEGTETTLGENYDLLTPFEVQSKFNIVDGQTYIFPRETIPEAVKEVNTIDSTGDIKKPTRKYTKRK